MRLYQVEISRIRSVYGNCPGKFVLVEAEDRETARRKARLELCGPREDVFWINEVLEEEAEAILA